MYRQELLTHVNQPEFVRLDFLEDLQPVRPGSALCTLQRLQVAIANDTENLLREVISKHSPVVSPKSLARSEKERWARTVMQYRRKSERIHNELGP